MKHNTQTLCHAQLDVHGAHTTAIPLTPELATPEYASQRNRDPVCAGGAAGAAASP
ncbi:hypothetical protein HK405_010807, partial [Cladochytrium tenue]